MIKLLILFGVGYLAYRGLKSWINPQAPAGRTVAGQGAERIDDVMVKDPFCQAYFPKRDAVHLKMDGRDLYFCSTACRDKFIAAKTDGKK